MSEHPGHAVQRVLRAYERDGPPDFAPAGAQSRWAPLRHQAMAERAIMQLAAAPPHVIDRAALSLTEEILQRHQDYNAYEIDDLAPDTVAGYAVGLDAVMRARQHRPTPEYLAGTTLLLSLDLPAENLADMLSAASDDRLRGIADHLICGKDPATGRSSCGEMIDARGGDASRLADLINAEISARNAHRSAPLAPIVLRGRHTRTGQGPRVGDSVRVPVAPTTVPSSVVYPQAGYARLWFPYRPNQPAPTHLTGVVTAVQTSGSPRSGNPDHSRSEGLLTVQVAGHGAITVPLGHAEAAPPFTAVDLIDDHGQVTDPLQAERLLDALTAWFDLDVRAASTSLFFHTADHDRIAEALADFSGQAVLDLMARIQQRADYQPLEEICARCPQLRRANDLFPPVKPPFPVAMTALEQPHRSSVPRAEPSAKSVPPGPGQAPSSRRPGRGGNTSP